MTRQSLIEEDDQVIAFRIPANGGVLEVFFAAFAFFALLFGVGLVAYVLVSGDLFRLNPGTPVVASVFGTFVWLALWTATGLHAMHVFLRLAVGVETLEFGPDALTVRFRVLGFVSERVYPCASVWNLRTRAKDRSILLRRQHFHWLDEGQQTLEFDFGNGQVRFGAGLSEAAAQTVLALVLQKFPQYAPRDPATLEPVIWGKAKSRDRARNTWFFVGA
jgi:hypothetical protein